MKRLRKVSPEKKHRKPKKLCLWCERKMSKRQWGRHRTDWFCPSCRFTYGYIDGVLKGIMSDKDNQFWGRNWRKIPEGSLMVYDCMETPEI